MSGLKFNMTGMDIGRTHVIRYIGDGKWECKCSCGNIMKVRGFNLRTALEEKRDYRCEECSAEDKRKDITDMTFGNWHVDKYLGHGMYQCTCKCEKHTVKSVLGKTLRNGLSTSCGCLIAEKARKTKLDRYGDITVNTSDKDRTLEQINASSTPEALKEFINKQFKNKPTLNLLANTIGITPSAVGRKIHKFKMESYIEYDSGESKEEIEVREILKNIKNLETQYNVRNVITDRELDIYIPSIKLAVEYNGSFWHSSVAKDRRYHQDKTIACARKGIHLIHIFDYEWSNEDTKRKIIDILRLRICGANNRIQARKCEVNNINLDDAKEFLNKYHLQGYIQSELAIGIKYNNELIGVLTFGKPRFNNTEQYELIRMAFKSDIIIIGGLQKMFKYFVRKYDPQTIVSYCNVGKFVGESYLKLGFKTCEKALTEPDYMWVNLRNMEALSRYKTQKKRLVKDGLGDINQTEDEIMENLGYVKVYGCGNLKFIWTKQPE